MLTAQELKQQAADAALSYVEDYLKQHADPEIVIGVGTGSTVDLFIDGLVRFKDRLRGTVASSERSAARLASHGLAVFDLNEVTSLPLYVDGADEIDDCLSMIKGGGGALTREKIVASVAERFVCIADESKQVSVLGTFALPVEVIPMARASVARALSKMGGEPRLRTDFVSDNGNPILDVSGLDLRDPIQVETCINDVPGVVTCGLFALRGADVVLLATQDGVLKKYA